MIRAPAALLVLLAACSGDAGSRSRVDVGLPVPQYAAVTLAGDSTSLAAQRGKVVLLNIWATWCHPCRAEIPELEAIHHRYKDRGLEIVGVSVDASGVPSTFLIDRQGILRWRKTGPVQPGDTTLVSAIERALGT